MAHLIFDELFVLELANNHWGRLSRGLKIIDDFAAVVKAHGVRASIKLQFRDVDTFIHPQYRNAQDYRYIKKTISTQMAWDELRQMVERIREHGMLTMVTPFDETSVDKAIEFGVDIIKIASSDIRDKTLLQKIASTRRPVIASSGGSSLQHIDDLVEMFTSRNIPFALNHCVSIYPSEDSELDLNQIDFLRRRYPNIVTGLSTHEHRDWQASIMIAYAKGARTFERHIDIDYEGVPVSAYCTRPEQAAIWFKAMKKAKEMCGPLAEVKREPPEEEVRYLDALVRGVYAKNDFPIGHILTGEDVFFAVPLLKGQLSPREYEGGERLLAPVFAGASIQFSKVYGKLSEDAQLAELISNRGIDPMDEGLRLRMAEAS